jgi:phospholipid/cholesterol/gamma-HCH transport system ATP-binding protein
MTVPIIEFKDVTKSFGGRTILERINLQIYEDEVTTIIGKSGAGKSLILKLIVGLLRPDSGSVIFQGEPLEHMNKSGWNDYLDRISYMFQSNALFDSLTVYENIALQLQENTRLSKQAIIDKVKAKIELTELSDVASKYPSELSGGMQKRVALARALVTDPKVVLFDELTTGQDPVRRNAILGMIAEYKRKCGFTAILVSHDIPDVFFISNRIIVLWDRRIVFQGTSEDLENINLAFFDEIIDSIENFGDELTGLYSKRQFKVRYQSDLNRKNINDTYAVILFTLADPDAMIKNLGHTALQEGIRTMGRYINKHFGAVGGFSARRSINQFETVLPFSNTEEAEQILENFARDFQKRGMKEIEAAVKASNPNTDCFEITIFAGLAKGNPHVELESELEIAEFMQKPIGRFQCGPSPPN